ncbi:MAG TPA: DUF455 family protein [Acidimicrobiales bacterium]|nr:DUF455 family protein [Acidimicrobiales bacterium]
MRKSFPVEDLARDERFVRVPITARLQDGRQIPRDAGTRKNGGRLTPDRADSPDAARVLMHGIFMGEVQALEGAGRTCWDFDTEDTSRRRGTGDADEPASTTPEVPFQLKLDMARQCWDEARHTEISVKLSEHMGTGIGEFAEATFLYEAACNPDPVLRLTGVNRALEGLAIDVFNTMREFGDISGDPVLEFCEDWMLADEVTHVKMGSDWLRKLTEKDPERRERALEFQRVVDRLFSLGGFRGEEEDSPVRLARRFRELAGFDTAEIDELADDAKAAREDAEATIEKNRQAATATAP